MFRALVLVRNLQSSAARLDFREFTFYRVGLRFGKLREDFFSREVDPEDWIFEKEYSLLQPSTSAFPLGAISNDIEDILTLLRLFRVGDVSFVRQTIIPPDGNNQLQLPNRAMNDVNRSSPLQYQINPQDCQQWEEFAARTRASQSWESNWFAIAKRFFLSGGAMKFNPGQHDVNRIVDYATALEATLVPETGYNTRRISRRAAALLRVHNPAEAEDIAKFVTVFYDIRSRIVHGDSLGNKNLDWLTQNWKRIETVVRWILKAALQQLPPDGPERKAALASLCDLSDADLGDFAISKFNEIKTEAVRRDVAAKIASLSQTPSNTPPAPAP